MSNDNTIRNLYIMLSNSAANNRFAKLLFLLNQDSDLTSRSIVTPVTGLTNLMSWTNRPRATKWGTFAFQ